MSKRRTPARALPALSTARRRLRTRPELPPEVFEERLDELLWQVAAELDPEAERAGPLEVSAERVRADVSRWMKTRIGEGSEPVEVSRIRRAAYPWLRAAAVVLAVGGLSVAGSWDGWVAPHSQILQTESAGDRAAALTGSEDAESWYARVARAPDPTRLGESPDARRCTSDSWYCVQARPTSSRSDL